MSNAERDDNRVTTLIGQNTVDPTISTKAHVNPGTDSLLIDQYNNPGRVITLPTSIPKDNNRIVVGLATRTDNGEPFPIMATPDGKLLIEN